MLIWAGLIFYLSSIPDLNSGLGYWDLILRKLAHAVEYAVLAALVARGVMGSAPVGKATVVWVAFAVSVLYAASDEFHQRFVPGRYGSWLDVGIDSLGAGIYCVYLKFK